MPSKAVRTLVRRFRVAAGLTQEELAERAGLSVGAVSAIERGTRRRPHPQTLRSLATALALSSADRSLLLSIAAGQPEGPVTVSSSSPVAQLPRDVGDLTGRELEVARVLTALAPPEGTQATPVAAISGKPGVGKSALAVHAAHRLRDRFSDGQLYVNLQGATAGLSPLTPLDALSRMLRSLGLEPSAISSEVEEAAAQFRSLAAKRRLLVLLDNARSSEQVRPLLPGSATCGVLVTSRLVLATLEGALALPLDVLSHEQALELLGRIAGPDRVAAEAPEAAEVVRACGHLPLAIRIAGVRLLARPAWPVRELRDQLADVSNRLEALRAGELAVRVSFDVSLQALQENVDPMDRMAAASFGLLSLPDGPDLGIEAAARLLDRSPPVAQALLERLVDAQLLETPRPDRYRFHDLVHLYAREHAARSLGEPECRAALSRLLGFYTATAWHTLTLLRPHDPRLAEADARWTAGGHEFTDPKAASSWLEVERPNLLAAVASAAQVAGELPGQLARGLSGFFQVRGYWHDWLRANEIALDVARRVRDRPGQARACGDIGRACERLGRYEEAIGRQQESMAIYRELGDSHAQAAGLTSLSASYWRVGQYEEAMAGLRESLALCRDLALRSVEADSLNLLGLLHGRLGRDDERITCQQESLAIFRELGRREGQAQCLNNLGLALGRVGRHEEAIACLHECLTICRELGHREGQGESLNTLGVVYGRQGRHEEAIVCQRASLGIFREAGVRRGQAVALRDLGDELRATGSDMDALVAWQEGLTICETMRLPQAGELRARLAQVGTGPFQLFTGP